MPAAVERFFQLVWFARARNGERIVFSIFLALLIAALLWQTRWLALRPGLAILLFGQAATTVILSHQSGRFSRAMRRWQQAPPEGSTMLGWFDEQETFIRRLGLLDLSLRGVGFVVLAYGFWHSTRLLWVAILLGAIFPATEYLGISRARDFKTIRELRRHKEELRARFFGTESSGMPAKRAV